MRPKLNIDKYIKLDSKNVLNSLLEENFASGPTCRLNNKLRENSTKKIEQRTNNFAKRNKYVENNRCVLEKRQNQSKFEDNVDKSIISSGKAGKSSIMIKKISKSQVVKSSITKNVENYLFENSLETIRKSQDCIEKENIDPHHKTKKGLQNIGNTCFMNAILQCLLNIELFSTDLMINFYVISTSKNWELEDDKNELQESLSGNLCELINNRHVLTKSEQTVLLRKLKRLVSSKSGHFKGNSQNDAQEFLCLLLCNLKEDFVMYGRKLDEAQPLKNPVVDNFEFIVRHTIKCKSCKNTVIKDHEYYDLCLDLPDCETYSIQNRLDAYLEREALSEFKCDKCAKICSATIFKNFIRVPRILIVCIKRHQLTANSPQFNGRVTRSTKIGGKEMNDNKRLSKNDASIAINPSIKVKQLLDKETPIQAKSVSIR